LFASNALDGTKREELCCELIYAALRARDARSDPSEADARSLHSRAVKAVAAMAAAEAAFADPALRPWLFAISGSRGSGHPTYPSKLKQLARARRLIEAAAVRLAQNRDAKRTAKTIEHRLYDQVASRLQTYGVGRKKRASLLILLPLADPSLRPVDVARAVDLLMDSRKKAR
jgi:hypothetical protein